MIRVTTVKMKMTLKLTASTLLPMNFVNRNFVALKVFRVKKQLLYCINDLLQLLGIEFVGPGRLG